MTFRALAIEFSSGQNALEGGDLGWRKAAQLPTIFSDLVEDMEVGETRSPIKSGREDSTFSSCSINVERRQKEKLRKQE